MTATLPPAGDLLEYKRQRLLALRARLVEEQRRQAEQLTSYQTDPVGWVNQRLGEHLWSKQAQIAESVRDQRRTAVPSAHDLGKSFVASRMAAWWLDVHLPGDAFIVSTAPTFQQVRGILWREIRRAHAKGHLPGRVNQTEWLIDEELVGFGRKPADVVEGSGGQTVTAMQGIHARYVLVILDEASGVPGALWDAADTLITNEESRILCIGNPDDPTSRFAEVCAPGSGWNVIQLNGFDSPNFTGEAIPDQLRPLLLSPVWVEEKRTSWGEDSPLWAAKILGEFPTEGTDTIIIPLSLVRRCQQEREYLTDPALPDFIDPRLTPVELGVDVGAGGDETVIRERRGLKVGRVWRTRSKDAAHAIGLVVQAARETEATRIKVDTIGVGWGVAGRLEELRRDGLLRAQVNPINVAESSNQPHRFRNLRDELWWTARETMSGGGWDLTGLDDDTIAQLTAPRYILDSAGRTRTEPKDETRKRIGRSPDDADALLLAYLEPRRVPSRRPVAW